MGGGQRASARGSSRPSQTSPWRHRVGGQSAGSGGRRGREGRVTQPQGLPGPPAARPPSPSNPGASADTHTTTSPGGTDTPGDLGPSASPRRRGLRSPPPHTRQSRVYTHKQLGAGGDASPPGWGCTPRRQPPLPFTRRSPLSVHTCPQTPTLKTPRNQTANAAHRRGSDSRLSFNVNGETYPTQMRGPRDASLRCTQAPAPGPQGQHSSAADKPPPPLPAAHPHSPPPRPASGTVTCSLKDPSRNPGHQPLRAGFSEPVNLTLAPPDGSVPQAQLHRGDRNE